MSKKKMHKTAINERIELLEEQSNLIRRELGTELEHTKKKAIDFGKLALGIGGGLVLSAIILRGIFGNQRDEDGKRVKPKRVYHKFKDQLIGEISGQALEFILNIAKDRISALHQQDPKKEKENAAFNSREE
jgi:hypothetical protein